MSDKKKWTKIVIHDRKIYIDGTFFGNVKSLTLKIVKEDEERGSK